MSIFVNDTFTGSGNLTTHVGEVGATWAKWLSSGVNQLANYVLSGAGSVSNPGDYATYFSPSGIAPGAEYYVEIEFSHTQTTWASAIEVGVRKAGTAGAATWGSSGYYFLMETNDVDTYLQCDVDGTGGSSTPEGGTGFNTVAALAANVTHTLRIEMRDALKRVLLDGVVVLSFTDNRIPDAGSIFMNMGPLLNISGFEAGTFGTPSDFVYDSFTGANGTGLESHTGEIGATWTFYEGAAPSNALQIKNNALIRPTSPTSGWGWGVQATASGLTTADYDIELVFHHVAPNAYSGLQLGTSIGGAAEVSLAAFYTSGGGAGEIYAGAGGYTAFAFASDIDYLIRVEVRGSQIQVFVDGELKRTSTITNVGPCNPTLRMDENGEQLLIKSFRASPVPVIPPSGLFWTANVGATEVTT